MTCDCCPSRMADICRKTRVADQDTGAEAQGKRKEERRKGECERERELARWHGKMLKDARWQGVETERKTGVREERGGD